MTCKRCNNELSENARFCSACGALQPLVCPACQAESRPGSRVCSGCGKKLPVSTDSAVQFYRRKKTPGQIAALVLLVLGAVLVLTAAVMFLVGTLSDVSEKEPPAEQSQEVSLELEKELDVVVEDPIKREDPNKTEPETDPETETEPVTEPETEADPETETETETETDPEAETETEPETETETETKPSVDRTEWFFPDSSERLLTDADIAGLSKAELQIARNEIYARHGRRFNNPDLQAWFNSCSWYEGTIAPNDFNEQLIFNETELANVYFLKAAE